MAKKVKKKRVSKNTSKVKTKNKSKVKNKKVKGFFRTKKAKISSKEKSKKETKKEIKSKEKSKKETKSKEKIITLNKNILIKIHSLSKQFHNKAVLKDVNLEIRKQEIFGLIGMSGSGKTTLLNLIIGFFEPDAGSIIFNNENKPIETKKNIKLIHKKIGFAPQEPSFYPKLTAFENLEHFGSLYGISLPIIHQNVEKLLKLTKLEYAKDSFAGELSFGMQKRLGIICALVHKPEILILDEPTADLDPILRSDILDLILKIKQQGITVIIASHFLDDMEQICDRVGVIKDGKIIKSSSIDEIRKSISFEQEVQFKTSSRKYTIFIKKLKSNKSLKIKKIVSENSNIRIQTNNPDKVIIQILKINKKIKDNIIEIKIQKPNLTELFRIIEK